MISKGPFQPKAFYNSMILWACTSNFDGSVYVRFTAYVSCLQFYVTAVTTTSLAREAWSFSLHFFSIFFSVSGCSPLKMYSYL